MNRSKNRETLYCTNCMEPKVNISLLEYPSEKNNRRYRVKRPVLDCNRQSEMNELMKEKKDKCAEPKVNISFLEYPPSEKNELAKVERRLDGLEMKRRLLDC